MAIIQRVSTANDARLNDYRNLTDVEWRRRIEPAAGLFIAESEKVIRRAAAAGYSARSVLTTERWVHSMQELYVSDDVDILVASESILQSVVGYRVHRGALAAMQRRSLPTLDEVLDGARRILVLEGLVDHTNVGAVFRSVAALGFGSVVLDPTCADPLYRRSVRVSMGAVFTIPWTRCVDWPAALDTIGAAGFSVIVLRPSAELSLSDVARDPPKHIALVLGSEGHGVSAAVLERESLAVRIPMSAHVDSLNVAAAAAVACYALTVSAP